MANEGFGWDPRAEKCNNNPGGDWHPGRGDNPEDNGENLLQVVFSVLFDSEHLKLFDNDPKEFLAFCWPSALIRRGCLGFLGFVSDFFVITLL